MGDVSNQLELLAHYQALCNSNRNTGALVTYSVSRFGLAVRRWAGKQKDFGSTIPLLLLSFFKRRWSVDTVSLVTLFLIINEILIYWLSSLLINAEIGYSAGDSVALGIVSSLPRPTPYFL